MEIQKTQVFKGNHTDSRIGNHSYACWTTTDDYVFICPDGKTIYLQTSHYDHLIIREIDPVDHTDFKEMKLENVDDAVACIFYKKSGMENPDTLEIRLRKACADNTYWSFNREELRKELEQFPNESVPGNPGNSRDRETQYKTPFGFFIENTWVYIGNWQSRLYSSETDKVSAATDSRKEFARMCGRASRIQQVPFAVALAFKGNEVNLEVFKKQILAAIAEGYGKDENICYELCCGRSRNSAAMELIGVDSFGVDTNRIAPYVAQCLEATEIVKA